MKIRWLWVCLFLLLLIPVFSSADVAWDGKTYTGNEEYIDLGDTVVKDFDAFTAFLDQMPDLKQVDMWANEMTADRCDMLASRYPDMRWGWTLVIQARDHKHLVRTDWTAWSTLHNKKSTAHTSEDFAILKYCWNLMALDIGHNAVASLDFLYDLPNLRVLIAALNNVTDITPVASLKNLEYAELFNNKITDVSPLKDLTHLMDLNITVNNIADFTPLANLTGLKRLWINGAHKRGFNPPPEEMVAPLREALPDTVINTVSGGTEGGWRYLNDAQTELDPHYRVIQMIFGENSKNPKHDYVPFDDSWPLDGSAITATAENIAEAAPAGQEIWEAASDASTAPVEMQASPEEEPVAAADSLPSLEPLVPQDFSDKGYLLPIDFSVGSEPLDECLIDENTYIDSTISVKVTRGNTGNCDYWYADIQVTDASQIRTMSASSSGAFDTPGAEMEAVSLSYGCNAVVAINGDYPDDFNKQGFGYNIRQGILYRNNLDDPNRKKSQLMDVLLIDEDGDFIVYHRPETGTIPATVNGKRILNSFSFGPVLVENGEAVMDFKGADQWLNMATEKYRQRMCICQVGPLHYMVVCCAGPYSGNKAMTLTEFRDLVASLGVQTAYNLDGGDSTLLYFFDDRINVFSTANKARPLTDIIYFASAE